MSVIRKEYAYPSKTGLSDIFARSWKPENPADIKAIFQITHGMAEHGERYADFAKALCENGYAVYCNDHAGHGKSVKADEDLGYFGEKDGWDAFVEDARALTEIAVGEHPDKPVIFFGHSMGSFVARAYARRYGSDKRIKGFVFCGTSGKNPGAPMGIVLAKLIARVKGSRHRSKLIDKIAFGSYNAKYAEVRTPFDWLTKDEEIVDYYIADKYCGFLFTAVGYKDMFTVLDSVSGKDWYAALNKKTPILVTGGAMDPVGAYAKGVEQVYNDLKLAGCADVTLKLYKDDRHEILNELDRKNVYADIAAWADSKL